LNKNQKDEPNSKYISTYVESAYSKNKMHISSFVSLKEPTHCCLLSTCDNNRTSSSDAWPLT